MGFFHAFGQPRVNSSSYELLPSVYNESKPSNATYTFDDTTAFVVTNILNVCALFGLILVFSILRKYFPYIYQPRCKLVNKRTSNSHPPTPLPRGLFSWIFPVGSIKSDEVLHSCGLDAYVVLSFCTFGFKVFGFGSIFGLLVLIPVNIYAAGDALGMQRLTTANIPKGNISLVAHLLYSWFFAFLVIYFGYKHYSEYTRLCQANMRKRCINNYSVMVRNITPDLQTSAALMDVSDRLFPDDVACALVNIGGTQKLDLLISERTKVLSSLETSLAYFKNKNERPVCYESYHVPFLKFNFLGKGNTTLDSITYYSAELDKFNILIENEQRYIRAIHSLPKKKQTINRLPSIDSMSNDSSGSDTELYNEDEESFASSSSIGFDPSSPDIELLNSQPTNAINANNWLSSSRNPSTNSFSLLNNELTTKLFGTNSGFITFKSLKSRTLALQTLLVNEPQHGFQVTPAPQPEEIIWKAIPLSDLERRSRSVFFWALSLLLIVFYTIPSAFIVYLMSPEHIRSLSWFKACPAFIQGFLQGFLPTSLLLLFIIILPFIFYAMGYVEGHVSKGKLEQSVIRKFYYFLLVNVFFTTAIATNVFQTGLFIVKNPPELAVLLGHSIPGVATNFINIIFMRTCISYPMELIRPGAWFLTQMGVLMSSTPRQLDQAREPPAALFGEIIPYLLLFFTIIITYAPIAPIVLPFGFFYFAFGYFVYAHQFLYVYLEKYAGNGTLWPLIFSRIFVALLLQQLTLIGIFILKKSQLVYGLFPLPIISILAYYFIEKRFSRYSRFLALESAIATDTRRSSNPYQEDTVFPDPDAYLLPSLQVGSERPQMKQVFRRPRHLDSVSIPTPVQRRNSMFDNIFNRRRNNSQ